MSLLWVRSTREETIYSTDERRVREFLEAPGGLSESVDSLASKLGIARGKCKRVLEQLVEEGLVTRKEFGDIEPIYYRFPGRG